MSKEIEIYVHGEGQKDAKLLKISEEASVRELLEKAKQSGVHISEPALILLEDEDDVVGLDANVGKVGHRKHLHCHRCRHAEVSVFYNGKTIRHAFPPSATGKRVRKWAMKEFGLSATDLVLMIKDSKTEIKDNDHIGSFVAYPHCKLELVLVPSVQVQG